MGMGVNGIGITGYPAWRKTAGNHKNPSGAGFAERMADVGWNAAGMSRFWQQGESSMRAGAQAAGSDATMEAYLASSVLQTYPAQPSLVVCDGKHVYETDELCRTMRRAALTFTISRVNGSVYLCIPT